MFKVWQIFSWMIALHKSAADRTIDWCTKGQQICMYAADLCAWQFAHYWFDYGSKILGCISFTQVETFNDKHEINIYLHFCIKFCMNLEFLANMGSNLHVCMHFGMKFCTNLACLGLDRPQRMNTYICKYIHKLWNTAKIFTGNGHPNLYLPQQNLNTNLIMFYATE